MPKKFKKSCKEKTTWNIFTRENAENEVINLDEIKNNKKKKNENK